MGNDAANCNCLHGTPVIDANGKCRCIDTFETRGQTPFGRDGSTVINNYFPAAGNPAVLPAEDPGTIFGFSPLLVLGAAAVGLYLLSSSGGEK